MTYSKPAETTTAELAKTVADEGWSVVGVLDRPLSRRLLRAVDEVAARRGATLAVARAGVNPLSACRARAPNPYGHACG
jgi:hypothetical protein